MRACGCEGVREGGKEGGRVGGKIVLNQLTVYLGQDAQSAI